MGNILSSLFDFRVKKQGIICALVFFILDLVIRFTGTKYLNEFSDHIYFHYMVLLGLIVAASSKDKEDDERLMQIRYFIFKNTLNLLVILFGISLLILSYLDIKNIGTLYIMYGIEALLVIHLVLYSLAKKYNPKWLFRENTAPKDYNNLMIGMIWSIYLLIVLRFILTIIF